MQVQKIDINVKCIDARGHPNNLTQDKLYRATSICDMFLTIIDDSGKELAYGINRFARELCIPGTISVIHITGTFTLPQEENEKVIWKGLENYGKTIKQDSGTVMVYLDALYWPEDDRGTREGLQYMGEFMSFESFKNSGSFSDLTIKG